MQINFLHAVYYDPQADLTLTEIENTLIAQERLALRAGAILESTIPGLKVEKVKIELRSLQISSLSEDFLVALFVAFQKDLTSEFMDIVERLTGVDVRRSTTLWCRSLS